MISKKKKLADFVIDEIKLMLLDGRLKEGEKLPNQNVFAQQLGVSRLSLREALNTLTNQGVISQQPGVGTIVLSGNPNMWAENPTPPMLSDSEATLELLETRKHLEIIVAKTAIEHITPDDLKMIEEDVFMMQKAVAERNINKYLKSDMAFHFHIACSCHNRYIINMFLTIRNLMEEFMLEAFEVFPELIENSYDYHMRIFESIKNRDSKKTSKYLLKHLKEIELKLKKYYSLNADS